MRGWPCPWVHHALVHAAHGEMKGELKKIKGWVRSKYEIVSLRYPVCAYNRTYGQEERAIQTGVCIPGLGGHTARHTHMAVACLIKCLLRAYIRRTFLRSGWWRDGWQRDGLSSRGNGIRCRALSGGSAVLRWCGSSTLECFRRCRYCGFEHAAAAAAATALRKCTFGTCTDSVVGCKCKGERNVDRDREPGHRGKSRYLWLLCRCDKCKFLCSGRSN